MDETRGDDPLKDPFGWLWCNSCYKVKGNSQGNLIITTTCKCCHISCKPCFKNLSKKSSGSGNWKCPICKGLTRVTPIDDSLPEKFKVRLDSNSLVKLEKKILYARQLQEKADRMYPMVASQLMAKSESKLAKAYQVFENRKGKEREILYETKNKLMAVRKERAKVDKEMDDIEERISMLTLSSERQSYRPPSSGRMGRETDSGYGRTPLPQFSERPSFQPSSSARKERETRSVYGRSQLKENPVQPRPSFPSNLKPLETNWKTPQQQHKRFKSFRY